MSEAQDIDRRQRYHIIHVSKGGKRNRVAIVEGPRRKARETVRHFKLALGKFETIFEEWAGPAQRPENDDEAI